MKRRGIGEVGKTDISEWRELFISPAVEPTADEQTPGIFFL
jgi:hypothetical protein